MTKLDPDAGHYVLINTFEVDPSKADELLSILSRATDEVMRFQPGFVSANLHISADKRHIANYAQWESKEDFDAMMGNPVARTHMGEAASVTTSFTPLFYALRESHSAG